MSLRLATSWVSAFDIYLEFRFVYWHAVRQEGFLGGSVVKNLPVMQEIQV